MIDVLSELTFLRARVGNLRDRTREMLDFCKSPETRLAPKCTDGQDIGAIIAAGSKLDFDHSPRCRPSTLRMKRFISSRPQILKNRGSGMQPDILKLAGTGPHD